MTTNKVHNEKNEECRHDPNDSNWLTHRGIPHDCICPQPSGKCWLCESTGAIYKYQGRLVCGKCFENEQKLTHAPTSVTGDEWDKQLHKIMQEEIADRVIYETHLGEETLRRGLQSAQSRIEALIISLLQAKTAQRTHIKQALLGRYEKEKQEGGVAERTSGGGWIVDFDDITRILNEELA